MKTTMANMNRAMMFVENSERELAKLTSALFPMICVSSETPEPERLPSVIKRRKFCSRLVL